MKMAPAAASNTPKTSQEGGSHHLNITWMEPAEVIGSLVENVPPVKPTSVHSDQAKCACTLTMPQEKQSQDISRMVGKHLVYTYENGWLYEIYVKNAKTMDYRIYSGPVARRWVKNQEVNVVRLSGEDRFKISWCEPTGTTVSLCIDLAARQHHGVIFFPQWIHQQPAKTAVFQNDHLDEMRRLRDAGPTYPICVVDEFAELILVEDVGVDNEQVISVSPTEFSTALKQICETNDLAYKLAHFGETWGSRDASDLVGKRLVYSYQNGWQHELYVRTASSIDYKISSSLGAAAWHSVTDHQAFILRLTGSNRCYIISWSELITGTSVSLTLDLDTQEVHGAHFFPQWVLNDTKELELHSLSISNNSNCQNASESSLQQHDDTHSPSPRGPKVEPVIACRDARHIYPLQLVSEFARISFTKDC